MGMYNEVYKKCPECGDKVEQHISQIVDGFGCFCLDSGFAIDDLSVDQRFQLAELVNDIDWWSCTGCDHAFKVHAQVALVKPPSNTVQVLL